MCDCFFNSQIPNTTETRVIIRPSSGTFVNGIAKSYDDNFPSQLKGHITEHEFKVMMENINDMLYTYFPCLLCWTCGYLCCPFTLGLSLCCPLICVRDAEENLRVMIFSINRKKLETKDLKLSLQKQCGTSWLELKLPSEVRKIEEQ